MQEKEVLPLAAHSAAGLALILDQLGFQPSGARIFAPLAGELAAYVGGIAVCKVTAKRFPLRSLPFERV